MDERDCHWGAAFESIVQRFPDRDILLPDFLNAIDITPDGDFG
jgi:hypothetical protein